MDYCRKEVMNDGISTIWSNELANEAMEKVREILLSVKENGKGLQVFFRADDIARVDEQFSRLMQIFQLHAMPLCLAVVPDWLDKDCWQALQEFRPDNPLWCWHQHGRNHNNHEMQGKKCEFGDSRSREAICTDLVCGKELLVQTLGDLFCPVFTPPWNRCSSTTLSLLKELDFKAVSRSTGAKPSAEGILPDLAVNVDLHTRRESDFAEGWQKLLAEFAEAAQGGQMGIMLHHQRMNEEAFAFLDLLLCELNSMRYVSCCTFRELLQD